MVAQDTSAGDMEAFELIPRGRGRVWYVVQIEGQKRFLLENLMPPGCHLGVRYQWDFSLPFPCAHPESRCFPRGPLPSTAGAIREALLAS